MFHSWIRFVIRHLSRRFLLFNSDIIKQAEHLIKSIFFKWSKNQEVKRATDTFVNVIQVRNKDWIDRKCNIASRSVKPKRKCKLQLNERISCSVNSQHSVRSHNETCITRNRQLEFLPCLSIGSSRMLHG